MAITIVNTSSTVNSITLTLRSDPVGVDHDAWGYRIGTGSWVNLGGPSPAFGPITVTGLSENTTYTISARASLGGVPVSASTTVTTKKNTIAPTVTTAISAIGTTSFVIKGSANYPCKIWEYQLNGGGWQSLSSTTSANSVSKEITELTPNTAYAVRVRATRTYNGVRGTSGTVNTATLGGSVLNSVVTIVADDETVNVTFNWTVQPGTGYTHTLRIKKDGVSVVAVAGLTGTTGSKTVTLSPAQRVELLIQIPNQKSFAGTLELETLDGATRVGNLSTKAVTVTTTEANSAPTFTSFAYSETNTAVSAVVPGQFVQSLSDIEGECSGGTAKNGASVAKYGITFTGKTKESLTPIIAFGAPQACGVDLPMLVWIEDSRGYRTTYTYDLTILCYALPEVTSWSARRRNSVEAVTALKVTGTIQAIPGNSLGAAQVQIKESNGEWGEWQTLTGVTSLGPVGTNRIGYEYDEAEWEELDSDKSYVVRLRFSDRFGAWSTAVSLSVSRGIPVASLRDGMIGINNPTPEAALDIIGGLVVDGVSVDDRLADIGKLLRFRANVTITKSTFSSSTGFHYQQLSVDIPAGYTGNTSAQWAQVQILSGGIWLISPISVTATKVNFYVATGIAFDFTASPLTYPAMVAVSIN